MGGTTGPVGKLTALVAILNQSPQARRHHPVIVGLHGMTVAMTIQVTVSRRLAASSADGRRAVGKGWRPNGQETVGVTVGG
jgi:hypothetical protein